MQVKQRLRINSIVSAVAVFVILVVLLLTIDRVNRALEAAKIADSLLTTSFERLILRTDLHRTGSERSKVQLIAKHGQIGVLLTAASQKFTDPEDKKIVQELLTNHESIGKISKTIRENREKMGPRARPDALSQEVEDRLLSQLNMRVYETILLDSKLQESGNKALISSLKLAGGVTLFVLLLVSAATLINSRITGRSIADRVQRLRDGSLVIGEGNLEHRIDIKGDDEFAELSEAFNAMTTKLSGSYHDLEKEIEERTRAEEALLKAHDELEQRIQERTGELKEANENLELHVAERTAELQSANSALRDSRRAALNMMEDADSARRRAEEANAELRNSEERYRSLFNMLLEGFCVIEVLFDADDRPVDYRFLECNPAFETQTGLCNVQGKLMRELAPEHEAHWFEIYGKVAVTGEPERFVNEAKALNRWYEVSAYRVGGQGSHKVAILFNDITESKRAQEALRKSEERVRLKLDSILSPEGDIGTLELADIIDARAMQSLMENFYKLTRMPMAMIDLKGKVLVGVGWQDVCTKFHRVHSETCTNCVESDTLLSAGVPQGEFKLYKCRNNMWDAATPIMVGGRHFGNFFMGQFFFEDESLDYELFRSQAREYGFDEKEYIAALESAPRLSRESLASGMAYFMELAEMISRTSYSNLKLARSIAERDTLMVSLKKAHDELEQRVEERTEELASTINFLKEEIAERERAEEKILRLNRLHAVLSETDQAIVRAADRDTLFHDFCRIAVENGGFLLAWIGLVDEETGRVEMVASHGATGYLADIRVSAREEPEGLGPTGIAVREGTYYICNDFLGDPCTRPWHAQGRAHGIGASAAIALKLHGKAIGALTLYADTKDFFDRQHAELLLQMGTEISFALDNLEREALRREAEQALQAETVKRLQAVEELRSSEQMLMQQSRQAAMGEMIGNIAHQWRQPLNVLGLIIQELPMNHELDALTRENLDASVKKATQVIQHMSQTIDDFRNFFSPDKEKALFKANDIVAKTVSLIDGSFREQHITIETSAEGDIFIYGYPNEYSQVILNILINARDAFIERRRSGPKGVIITLSREYDKAVATIADNAGGIAEEIMEKIFDPYFTTKGPDKGTGVGLFMSKTIIEKNMSGRLSARNSADGAEFRIEV